MKRILMQVSLAVGLVMGVARVVRRACTPALLAVVLSSGFVSVSNAAVDPTCVGDCDNSGAVTVDEIVKGVSIALGTLPLDQCSRFDCNGSGEVTIDCIINAVSAALSGCQSTPTSSPTQNIGTATPADTPTLISTPAATRSSTLTSTPTATNTPTATPTIATAMCGTFLGKFGSQGSRDGQFFDPEAIAVDQNGNIFVADTGNHRVEKFTSTGIFLLQWGSMGSANGQFHSPEGIAVDGAGNVFVTDLNNNRVEKFDNSGTFLTTWGDAGTGDGQFSGPLGVAIDTTGNVFVADRFNNRVQKFTNTGTFLTKWGTAGSGDGQFANPVGVAVDGNLNVYVADFFNDRIQKFTDTGDFLAKWGSTGSGDAQFIGARAVAVDEDANVFAVDDGNDRIEVFTDTGTFLATWGTPGTHDGQFNSVTAVAVDANGQILATDESNRVQRFACPSPDALSPVRTCAADAVLAGTVCLDRYEASVWRVPNPTTTNASLVNKIQLGSATEADLTAGEATQLGTTSDDYAPCAKNGQNCANDIYAVSLPSVIPAAFITWFQAQEACANSGKRLATSAEWQVGANGTPDPGPDDHATTCNSANNGSTTLTGGRSRCVSARGAFDMVGNVAEWVADWVPLSTQCPDWGGFSDDLMCLSGASESEAGPGALLRGGFFHFGAFNGPLAVIGTVAPTRSQDIFGFRCAS